MLKHQVQAEGKTIIQKIRVFIPYLFAVLCGVIFFFFELFPANSDDYLEAKSEFNQLKKQNTTALIKVKDAARTTAEYKEYVVINKSKNLAFSKLSNIKKEEAVFGFKNMRVFFYHFGIAIVLFLYGSYNLVRSFYFERKNLGNKVMHGFVINIAMFKFYWVLQSYEDYSFVSYFLMSILSAILMVLTLYYITKYKKSRINELKGDIREISRFTVLNTKPGKQKEMFNLFNKLLKSK